ncbi:unnamed protein product [Heterobilharzia americana]|nr:unnamed protein product [Heterobilharzia americana]
MPRQAEPIFPEDQPPVVPNPEKPKKSKHHSTKSSINNPAGDKEKYIKAKSTKNKNESSEFINSKLPSNVVSQPENLNKGDSFKNEIVTEKCKHEHGKKRRKHSKGESKHEKRSRRDEVNSEVTVELPHVKEPTRKHKHHDKSHGSSHLPKTSTTYGKPPRPNKSVAYEDACHQTISASLREKSNEADIHASSPYEPVPGTPSSVSGCSSHLSRSSSCSRSPLRSSRHQRRLVHDSHCNEKSYKQKYERSSRSPSIHFTHDRKPEHHRSANNAQDNNLEEKYNTNKRTQQSVSPPSKPKRYDSALTYGYRQSTQRRHLSPRHRSHSRRHAPHRERSRSDSERFDSRKTAYRPGDKERVHQKTFHTKVKPRFYNPDENTDVRKSHGSKNIDHHSTRDSHSTRRRSSGSHRRDLHEDIESLSPSPKRSDGKYEPRNLYTRQQAYNLSKCHSDPHSPPAQKQDRQGDAHEVLDSGSPNRN